DRRAWYPRDTYRANRRHLSRPVRAPSDGVRSHRGGRIAALDVAGSIVPRAKRKLRALLAPVTCPTFASPLAPAARRRRPRRHGADNPLEIGLRSGVAVDRHVLRHIELQPLEVPVERNSIQVDIRRRRPGRRRSIEIAVDHDLLLRE